MRILLDGWSGSGAGCSTGDRVDLTTDVTGKLLLFDLMEHPSGATANMIGVGLDLVDVARVEQLLARHGDRVLRRLLTSRERNYCMSQAVPARHVAARIAAKEAAYKAFAQGAGERVVWWLDVEVVREPSGLPSLSFHGRASANAAELRVSHSLLSLTHSEASAAAVVLLFR